MAKIGIYGVLGLAAIIASARAHDQLLAVHMWIVAAVLVAAIVVTARRSEVAELPVDASRYMDSVVRAGVVATVFWGVAGFLLGVIVALQLAWPDLNLEPYFTFGRLRPIHTSGVIFAFGGNALIATSFYVVQRTCQTRLAFDDLDGAAVRMLDDGDESAPPAG